MNNFTKIALGAGLLGATLLGTAMPATAAPAGAPGSSSTQESDGRLKGPFTMTTDNISNRAWTVTETSYVGTGYYATGNTEGPEKGFTFPGYLKTGQIRDETSGLCVSTRVNVQGTLTAQTCSNEADQQWTNTNSGRKAEFHPASNRNLFLNIPRVGGAVTLTSDPALMQLYINPNLLTEVGDEDDSATDVKFTTPENNAVVPNQPTFAGKGKPGASVTLTDGNGVAYGTTEVDEDGNWRFVLMNAMTPGQKKMTATQTDSDGNVTTATLDITVVDESDTPIIDPMVAAAAGGVLALGLAGTVLARRRIKA